MRILNLYAGIGGNRKLWGEEHEVTAVEPEVGLKILQFAVNPVKLQGDLLQ